MFPGRDPGLEFRQQPPDVWTAHFRMSKKRAETRTINVKQTIEKRMSRKIEQNGWSSLTASISMRDVFFGRDREI